MHLPLSKIILLQFLGVCLAGSLSGQALNDEILHDGHKHTLAELSATAQILSLSFGDSIQKELDDHAFWQILNAEEGNIIASGTGSIKNFQFAEPGEYRLVVPSHTSLLDGTCEHHFQTEETIVIVSPFRMKFDFSQITFSQPIVGGTDLSNVEISVPATLEISVDSLPQYNGKIASSGIGANLTGQLANGPIQLNRGLNTLNFKLNGNAQKDTYIMLDFYDVNNQIHCYYFPNKLK